MAVEKNCLRAKLRGGAKRHRRVNAEAARFVTGGGNHSALIALASDDNGQAFQFRARQQLDRNEKCVHIDVENRGDRVYCGGWGYIVLRAELGQLGHRDAFANYTTEAARTRGIPARSFVMLTFAHLRCTWNILRTLSAEL